MNFNTKSAAKEIYIVRHGQTNYNLKKIVQGRGVNSNLNETGQQQAKRFFDHYQEMTFDVIYASALQRTYQTMLPFTEKGYKIQQFTHLDEMDWGAHEGTQPSKTVRAEYKQLVADWENGLLEKKTEGGESPVEVQNRLKEFLNYLNQKNYQRVLLCTHGRTSRILMCTLLGHPLSKMNYFEHQNTALSKVYWENGSYKLSFFNNVEHLKLQI